jgi:hypothetical protein
MVSVHFRSTTLNREQRITEVFAGDLFVEHRCGLRGSHPASCNWSSAVRRRPDDQLGVSARPESVSGREGDVSRGEVVRSAARSCAPPRPPTIACTDPTGRCCIITVARKLLAMIGAQIFRP